MSKVQKNEIEPILFKTGDILFRENEQSFHFYIIQSGQVEIFKTTDNGTKIPLAIVSQGTSIGEFAMIDRLPRSATAQALSEVKTVRVSETAYKRLLNDLPEWAVSVMKSLVERIRMTNDIIRSSQIVDSKLRRDIEGVEYEPDTSASLKVDFDPFDDNGTPDLV